MPTSWCAIPARIPHTVAFSDFSLFATSLRAKHKGQSSKSITIVSSYVDIICINISLTFWYFPAMKLLFERTNHSSQVTVAQPQELWVQRQCGGGKQKRTENFFNWFCTCLLQRLTCSDCTVIASPTVMACVLHWGRFCNFMWIEIGLITPYGLLKEKVKNVPFKNYSCRCSQSPRVGIQPLWVTDSVTATTENSCKNNFLSTRQ